MEALVFFALIGAFVGFVVYKAKQKKANSTAPSGGKGNDHRSNSN